jgi:hypothetical protein
MIKKINENNNVFEDNIAFIHEYDFSQANSSHEARLEAITTIASVCYNNPNKIGNQGLYDRLANEDNCSWKDLYEWSAIELLNRMEYILHKDLSTKNKV